MAQILTVCRIGTEWGFRDVTGEAYGHSGDIETVVAAANEMANHVVGSRVAFTQEAEQHLHSVRAEVSPDSARRKPTDWLRLRSLWARLSRPRDSR